MTMQMQAVAEEEGRELISVKTLSHMIDVPERTIRHWVLVRYRGIPFVKLAGGHQLRFPLEKIRPWYMGLPSDGKSVKLSKRQ